MEEAMAGEAFQAAALSSFGNYGPHVLIIGVLLYIGCKGLNKWFDASLYRETRDAEIRKQMYQSINALSDALNRNSDTTERHTKAIIEMTGSVGKLPCNSRDPGLRTRAGDK